MVFGDLAVGGCGWLFGRSGALARADSARPDALPGVRVWRYCFLPC